MFPQDLVNQILIRLPVKSLMRFKCVDPSCRDLLTRPSFIRKHMYNNKKERLLVFERGFHGMMISADNYEESECPPIPDELRIQVIGGGSYNGVFCIQGRDHHLYFWNPSTREVKLVSPPPYSYIDPCYDTHLCCFGGDPNTNVLNLFYLFVISEYDDHNIEHFLPPSIELYNLTTNSWTILDNHTTLLPVPSQCIIPGDGILANGVSHWFAGEDPYDRWILCFNFRNNQFHKLDRPPQNNNSSCKVGSYFLAEINNSIAYVVRRKLPNLPTWGVDIWILEEEGSCWTKRYIFEPLDGPLRIYTIWKGGTEFLGPSRYQQFYSHRDDNKKIYLCRDGEEPVYLASYNSAGQLVHCFRQLIPLSRFLKYVESIAPLSFP